MSTPGPPLKDALPYRKPKPGRDYWVVDNILPNPEEVVERSLSKPDWMQGAPWKPEVWPGIRAPHGLLPGELSRVEDVILRETGAKTLYQDNLRGPLALSHNHVQIVGEKESVAKPHVDSLALCNFAGVIYLHPKPPKHTGTSFYRLRLAPGRLGGNLCPAGCTNLVQALGVRQVPANAWELDLELENVFNRLVVYRADLVHSATAYFGSENNRSKRMTIVFFWKATF